MAFSLMGIISVVLEVFRGAIPLLLVIAAIDLVLLGLFFAKKGGRTVRLGLPVKASIGVGVVVAVLAFISLPSLTNSSFAMLSGALDYLSLIGSSIGFGVLFGLLVLPPLLLFLGLKEANASTAGAAAAVGQT
ncbi:hypothetical protein DFR31_0348 [Alkalispirillum mobile]|uniref:Uncharacterized protein n=1 Tax=Alkalispirillum mobile TaxID=85925 RepID=A0A498CBG2_9GAMM|nr:hypothetical protein [Alkalispirillum mobile]RLK50450.1 hypothetical protein DFR31_0348 [Alkalispirillum mobile]